MNSAIYLANPCSKAQLQKISSHLNSYSTPLILVLYDTMIVYWFNLILLGKKSNEQVLYFVFVTDVTHVEFSTNTGLIKPIKATFEKYVFWYIHDSEYSKNVLMLSIYILHLCLEDTLKVSFNMYLPLIFHFPPGNPATHLKILLQHSGKNTATDARYIMCCKSL